MNINAFKKVLYGLAFLTIIMYSLGLIWQTKMFQHLSWLDLIKPFLNVVSIEFFIVIFFIQYAWKWPFFKGWLVQIPDINGTWKGTLISTWNETDKEKHAFLVIHQTLLNISCVMRTKEMVSNSFIAGFRLNSDQQIKHLIYSYTSTPKQIVKHVSPQHFGSAIFEIDEQKNKLIGEYWTDRKTSGNIELKFWKKEKIQSYPEDED